MKPHPIQHLDTTILEVNFVTNWNYDPDGEEDFNFNDVEIGIFSDIKLIEDDDYHQFAVRLGIDVENKTGKACPYTFNVEIGGLFEITKKINSENISDVVKQHATQILSVVIREMVGNISARGAFGPLQLPSMLFPMADQPQNKTRSTKSTKAKTEVSDPKKTSVRRSPVSKK